MADFKETLDICKRRGGYAYSWRKIDLADNSLIDFEYAESTTGSDMINFCKTKFPDEAPSAFEVLLRKGSVYLETEY